MSVGVCPCQVGVEGVAGLFCTMAVDAFDLLCVHPLLAEALVLLFPTCLPEFVLVTQTAFSGFKPRGDPSHHLLHPITP